jgi:glycerol-3-phosphate dehydrogenase
VLDASYPPPQAGLLITETEDDRVLFVLPWQGRCLIGTTDQVTQLSEHPQATQEDINYLLRHLAKVLDPPPTTDNITASWSGLRPLVRDPKAHDSARVLRDFVIDESSSGLFTIVGGKWTSYRRMAEKLVDQVVAQRKLPSAACRTKNLPVLGARNWQPNGWRTLATDFSLPEPIARYLHANYGCYASEVAFIAVQGFAAQLTESMPCIEAEVIYACRFEMAERAIDLIARRLPLALLDTQLAQQVAPQVLEMMNQEKGWNQQRYAEEKQLLQDRLTIAL